MSGLDFQNFDDTAGLGSAADSGNIGDDRAQLIENEQGAELGGGEKKSPGFWTFDYYQQFFDIDTDQVTNRLVNSAIPRVGGNFIAQHIRPIPDLYGPFWVSVTLVFTTAICGNLTRYIQSAASHQDYHWEYDFRIVTASASVIFGYVCILPLAIYAFLWWRKSETAYSYLELLSLYGYSLSVFVPVSILWVIEFAWLQWTFIAIAVFLSGSVLVFTLWPAVKNDQKLVAILFVAGVIGLHALLAVGFKEFFFESSSSSQVESSPETPTFNVPPSVTGVNPTNSDRNPTPTAPNANLQNPNPEAQSKPENGKRETSQNGNQNPQTKTESEKIDKPKTETVENPTEGKPAEQHLPTKPGETVSVKNH